MARPTKYSKKKLQITENYIAECIEREDTPYLEYLAVVLLDVDESTVWKWTKKTRSDGRPKYPKFVNAIKKLKTYQKYRLFKDGNEGKQTPSTTIFQLKANHGLADRQIIEHTGAKGKPLFDRSLPERDRHKQLLKDSAEQLEAMGLQMPEVKQLESKNDKQSK